MVVVELEVLTELEMLGPMAAGELQGCSRWLHSYKASNIFSKISNFSILSSLISSSLTFIQINLSYSELFKIVLSVV